MSHLREVLRDKGNVYIMVAVVLPALLGITGLALDYGMGAWAKSRLQRAADAGALGGATYIDDHMVAEQKAASLVAANFDSPDVAVYTPMSDKYKVELIKNVPTIFMRIFGRTNMEVSATATARKKMPVGGLDGKIFPFCIINPDINLDPCDDLVPSNYGRPYIIKYGNNKIVQTWAEDPCNPPYSKKDHHDEHEGDDDHHDDHEDDDEHDDHEDDDEHDDDHEIDDHDEEWQGGLNLNTDGSIAWSGRADFEDNITDGWPGTMNVDDEVPPVDGGKKSKIKANRAARLGSDPIPWDSFDPGEDGDSSRVILVPVVHLLQEGGSSPFTVSDWYNEVDYDMDKVVVDGFAPFFLLSKQEQKDLFDAKEDVIVGYFIPGVGVYNGLDPGGSQPDMGLYDPPRLID